MHILWKPLDLKMFSNILYLVTGRNRHQRKDVKALKGLFNFSTCAVRPLLLFATEAQAQREIKRF